MSSVGEERKTFEAPTDGEFSVIIDGIEHDYAVDEGEEIVMEWEADPR